ncbi:hypothetical protein [Streptomyces sp. NPDC001153]
MSEEDLVAETGLARGQIDLAVLWNNLEAQRWHDWFGDPEEDGG